MMSDIVPPFSEKIRRDWDLVLSHKNFKEVIKDFCEKYQVTSKVERLKQDPFPSTYLLAKFSELGYKDCDKINSKLPEGWFLLTTAHNRDVRNKYFGAALCNPSLQQVVIAHRGTDMREFLASLFTDIIGIYYNKFVDQISSAVTFTHMLVEALNEISDELNTSFQLSFTGHSLGGWLAQITTFTVKYLKMDSQFFFRDETVNCHAHCEVFDTPGCEEMLNKLKRTYDLRYNSPLMLNELDISCFLSAPNKINTCNHHVGNLYRLNLDFTDKRCDFLSYDFASHGIKFLLSAFSKEQDLSSETICEVLNWPSGFEECAAFFKHTSKINNFHLHCSQTLIQNDMGQFYNTVYYHTTEYKKETCSLRLFTQEELWFLEYWDALVKEHVNFDKINNFFRNNLQYSADITMNFTVDIKNRKLHCTSKEELQKVVRITKQLMRWFRKDIIEVLKTQGAAVPSSVHAMLHAVTTNYILPLKGNELNFRDVLNLETFLKSSDKYILNLIIRTTSVECERLRFYNIFRNVKELRSEDVQVKNYTSDSKYVFITWKHLVHLHNLIDVSYIFKSDCKVNFIVIDFLHSLVFSDQNDENLLTYILNTLKERVNDGKKVILLTSDSYDKEMVTDSPIGLSNRKEIESVKIDSIAFSDLERDSQLMVLDKIKVRFQNDLLSLKDILSKGSITTGELDHLNSLITSSVLCRFINMGLHLEVTSTFPRLCDAEVSQTRFNREFTDKEFKQLTDKNDGRFSFFITSFCMFHDEEEALKKFMDYCYKNQHETVFWFHYVDTQSVMLKQLYNANFYIHRQLNYQIILRASQKPVMKTENPDLFIFSNLSSDTNKTSFMKNLSSSIFLVDENITFASSDEDAEIMFNQKLQGTRSIHWFKVVTEEGNKKYVWHKSKGTLENLRQNIILNKELYLEESDLCNENRKVMIISDGPGAGKSTMLTHLFGGMKNAWVVRVDLKNCENLVNLKEIISIDTIVQMLLPKIRNNNINSFSRYLLKYLLRTGESNISLYLLFDGFDEIRGKTEDLTVRLENYIVKLLKYLKDNTRASILITTHDNKKEKLEDALSVFAVKFNEIKQEDLKLFVETFWTCRQYMDLLINHSSENMIEKRKKYIEILLDNAKEVFGNDINHFISVPLQIRIFAEVMEPSLEMMENFSKYEIQIPTNILNLFQKYVEGKYKIYFKQKTRLAMALNYVTEIWLKEKISEKHKYLAWMKVFNTGENLFECSLQEYMELNTAGLIQVNSYDLNFDFIDATVADYFVTEMLMEILKGKNQLIGYLDVNKLLLKSVLLLPSHKVVRQFLDCHFSVCLESELLYLKKQIVEALRDTTHTCCDTHKRTFLHIINLEKCSYVLQFLIKTMIENKNAAKDFISLHEVRDTENKTALCIALQSNFTIGINAYLDLLLSCEEEDREKLFLATFFKQADDLKSIEVQTFTNYVENSKKYKELLQVFSKVKEKFEYIAKFHKAAKLGIISDLKYCLENIGSTIYKKYLLLTTDKELSTPLLMALQNSQQEVVTYLISVGADVKTEDKFGMTAVAWAAKRGLLELIKMLIDLGCSYEKPDRNRINPMQHAAKNGHYETLKYFIETLSIDVDYKDRFGNTALSWATRSNYLKNVKYLLDKGADIESENRHLMRPLHIAIKAQNWAIFKELIKRGAKLDVPNGYGVLPIDQTSRTGKGDMVKLLTEVLKARTKVK